MDKSAKVFRCPFLIGMACGIRRCLESLSHSATDHNGSPNKDTGGDSEMNKLLKAIATVFNNFGEKLEVEADIQSSPFHSTLDINGTPPEKTITATGAAQQMSDVFEELVQSFRQLIYRRNEINPLLLDRNTNVKQIEKTVSITDMASELREISQEMVQILTQIVGTLKKHENTLHRSSLRDINGCPSEKTNVTIGKSSSAMVEETGDITVSELQIFQDDDKERTDRETGGGVFTAQTDKDDVTVDKSDYGENQNHYGESEDKKGDEMFSECDENVNTVYQAVVSERNTIGSLSEGRSGDQHAHIESMEDEDTADEVTTAMEFDSGVLTEDEDVTSKVPKELLELSAERTFRAHMEKDGVDVDIFRTPHDHPTKHPSYTCRLLGLEAVGCGRSKRTAKRNALCNMVHLLLEKQREGNLPKDISPFINEELWALEDVCLGGDDYLSQLRHLCDSDKAPPPVFHVQISKGSSGDKTFTVKCTALGRTTVGSCTRKRTAKRYAAREIIKQYEEAAAAIGLGVAETA